MSVLVGLKLPHDPVGVQVQLTPELSLVVAENIAVALVASVVGTPTRETVMAGAVTAIVAEAEVVLSVTEVAVTVTVVAEAGAV